LFNLFINSALFTIAFRWIADLRSDMNKQDNNIQGGKVIDKISKAIRDKYPEKKGYSTRNLKYMCQFTKQYPLNTINQLIVADKKLETPTIAKVLLVTKSLNDYEIGQEVLAQIQTTNSEDNIITQQPLAQIQDIPLVLAQITQEPLAQIEQLFSNSAIAKINWASHVILMNSKLNLGFRYWYMKTISQPHFPLHKAI
jgi:hypothetical protein